MYQLQVVPLGGFYIADLKVFIEFYRNLSEDCEPTKRVSFCPYYQVPSFVRHNCTRECPRGEPDPNSAQTKLNLCDWRSLDEPCFKIDPSGSGGVYESVWPSILSVDISKHLQSGTQCTFAYDPASQKMIYIFSDKDHPFVLNSLRTVSLAPRVPWFTKDIRLYRKFKFVGAFNWPPSSNSSSIYLMAQSQWMRNNSTLLQLIDTGKFAIELKVGSHSENIWV